MDDKVPEQVNTKSYNAYTMQFSNYIILNIVGVDMINPYGFRMRVGLAYPLRVVKGKEQRLWQEGHPTIKIQAKLSLRYKIDA